MPLLRPVLRQLSPSIRIVQQDRHGVHGDGISESEFIVLVEDEPPHLDCMNHAEILLLTRCEENSIGIVSPLLATLAARRKQYIRSRDR